LSEPEELPEALHNLLIESLRQYMFVGGMPECVEVWRTTNSLTKVFDSQSNLIETFRRDFSKYAPYTDKRSLNHALSMGAKNTGNQIKYTQLSDEFTGPTNKKAFELLQLAMLIHKIRAASPASLPLAASASESRFKAILTDMGLLQALNDFPANVEFMKNDLLGMYNGHLAEQFVGQEFISAGLGNPYYWSREARNSSAEVDYLIVKNNRVYPIEIKSGAAGKLRSMHLLLQKFPQIDQGFVLSSAPFGQLPDQKLTFLPYIMLMVWFKMTIRVSSTGESEARHVCGDSCL
jgi:uncharacterized protein